MARVSKVLVGCVVLGAFLCGGCADPKKDADAQAFNEQAAHLQQLQDELARLQAENAGHLNRINSLESENGQLKSELAGGGAAGSAPDGWKSIPGGAMISVEGTVLFDSGKAALKTTGKGTLGQIAKTIAAQYPDHDVYVFGHTDTDPIKHSSWKDNYELSCQRALSVVRHLRSQGITSATLAACGWGEYRPVASNTSQTERSLNRRVEIFVMAPHGNTKGQRVAIGD